MKNYLLWIELFFTCSFIEISCHKIDSEINNKNNVNNRVYKLKWNRVKKLRLKTCINWYKYYIPSNYELLNPFQKNYTLAKFKFTYPIILRVLIKIKVDRMMISKSHLILNEWLILNNQVLLFSLSSLFNISFIVRFELRFKRVYDWLILHIEFNFKNSSCIKFIYSMTESSWTFAFLSLVNLLLNVRSITLEICLLYFIFQGSSLWYLECSYYHTLILYFINKGAIFSFN